MLPVWPNRGVIQCGHCFLATYVDSRRLQSCLLWSSNCESDNVRNTLVFLSQFTSSLLISRVLSYVYTLLDNLRVHCCSTQLHCIVYTHEFSIDIIQFKLLQWSSVVPVSHQFTHIQWRPQPQTNKVRFNTCR